MSVIKIRLRTSTDRGRLYPRYDEDSGILAAETTVERKWPYAVNVDGLVVMDVDENRILANLDLHVPRRWWKVLEPFPYDIRARRAADIEFTEETLKQRDFFPSVTVETNNPRSQVLIRFDEIAGDVQAVGLSRSCVVLLQADQLLGFLIELGQQ